MAPAGDIWRRIVPPLVAGFMVFLAMLRVAARPAAAPVPESRRSWGAFARYLAVTALGGYLTLMAIVLVFHVLLARDGAALRSAAAGGAALLAIVVPVFVVAEAASRRFRP